MAPLVGGLFADFFSSRQLVLLVRWSNPDQVLHWPLILMSWDFYFLLAGLVGLYAVHRLSMISEQGEIEPREMVNHMLSETRRNIRNISTVAGFRAATEVSASLLRDARIRLRLARLQTVRRRRDSEPHR